MKIIICLALLFNVVILPVPGFSQQVVQGKKALIIAIGDYPDPQLNKWPKLSSANDIPLVKNTLIQQGFKPEAISILKEAAATRAGIETALNRLAAAVQKGDIVVIHISAHGAQIEDNDAEEEPDMLDECIVPYGARYSNNPVKFKDIRNDYFRDDELGEAIIKIRNRIGKSGHVLVILDACHSGSGTRNNGDMVRGPNNAIVSAGFATRKLTGQVAPDIVEIKKNNTTLSKEAGTYISFSGARAYQVNAECMGDDNRPVGSLSYAFSKAMGQLRKGSTYRTLFTAIQNIMGQKVPGQSPVNEGDGLDIELFGNAFTIQQPYLTIDANNSRNNTVVLEGGSIWGVTQGSEVSFYEANIQDPSGEIPLATGTVTRVNEFKAEVVLSAPGAKDLADRHARAFVTALAWGQRKIKLAVMDSNGKPAMQKEMELFRKALAGFELVEFAPPYDVYLEPNTANSNWSLRKRNDNTAFNDHITIADEKGVEALKEVLRQYDRVEYLKGLAINAEGLSGRIELVFLDAAKNIDTAKLNRRTINNRLELVEGDTVYLKLVNTGEKDFYYNVLDIEPGGRINRVVPNRRLRTASGAEDPFMIEDCLLSKSDSVIIRQVRIKIAKPYGNETFKVFLTQKAISLEDLLATDDANKDRSVKGAMSNLEKIFINSKVNIAGRRSGLIPLREEPATIFNYNFSINKKETSGE